MRIRRMLGWTALGIPPVLALIVAVAYWRSTNACDDPVSAALRNPMRAVTYCEYGSPGVLRIARLERPAPAAGELLVKVHAAATNPYDWHFIRGRPYVMRLMTGIGKPKDIRIGVDFAGTVESVGSGVTRFKPGNAIFGARTGAFADYVTVRENGAVALKPAKLTFEEAAGINIAGVTAIQGLRQARVGPGTRLLINGASGGVGTFAVQLAKAMGAHVTGVCSTRNVDRVRALGADEVIDYTREDYTRSGRRFDAVMDNVANHGYLANRRVLEPDGVYVQVGGGGPEDGRWIGPLTGLAKAPLLRPFVPQEMGVLMSELSVEDLRTLAKLVDEDRLAPVMDRRYPLEDVVAAMRYLESGRARGKVILQMDERSTSR